MRPAHAALLLVAAALLGACQTAPSAPSATAENQKPVRIALVGDSTQTERQGYGTGFCANLVERVTCLNTAKGGSSTKTFRNEGLWNRAVQLKPDWMLIQFGHNDVQTGTRGVRETDLVTEYTPNLRRYVEEARAAGIQPILVTPIARRYFQPDGKIRDDLPAHVEAMKAVAAEMKVPLIDLHTISQDFFEKLGETEAHKLGPTKSDGKGGIVPDKTHFNLEGSHVLGRMVVEAMGRAVPELAPLVRKTPAAR
ncbi:rhamnogalacturonan acetylesterase [Viridibacterium curvum]|uniref:SGNH hydrolase-type esterase domain-containing protein n=1 Tax=Viridibacterium curvum TaxID=1101404 RepID=A0ABP9QEE9_9RHOO